MRYPTNSELLTLSIKDLNRLLKIHEKHERYEMCERIKKMIALKKRLWGSL